MKNTHKYLMATIAATLLATANVSADTQNASGDNTKYEMSAKDAQVIRRVLGPISDSINGVPAAPVDVFDWSGSEITAVKGNAKFVLDPVNNSGKIEAEWSDEYGDWTYTQTMFAPPSHPTGVRFAASASATTEIMDDPITTNVYLHGDTGAGGPVLPTVFNIIATWGPSKITLNGMDFDNPYDGPTPMWAGHTMLSEGVRDAMGAVSTVSGDVFDMTKSAEGKVYPDELVFHLVFHDAPGPDMTANIPPPFSFFYHVTFSKIKLKVKHGK